MEKSTERTENPGSGWTSRSIGKRWHHSVFYLLVRLGGRRAAYFLLGFVVLYYILFSPSARARCAPYLARRFSGAGGLARLLHCYQMVAGLGRALIDRAIVGILGTDRVEVSFADQEKLASLLAEGVGAVVLNSHVGGWQVAMSALGLIDWRVHMLMHRDEGDVDRHWFEHAGIEQPYEVIDPTGYMGGTLEMMGALKNGDVVCIMGDRLLGNNKNSVSVEFLGEEAPFPVSGFVVAAAAGAPVVVLLSRKSGPASYELELADVIRMEEDLGRNPEAYRPYVERYVKGLETYVRDNPYQFFNFFDLWNPHAQGDGESS